MCMRVCVCTCTCVGAHVVEDGQVVLDHHDVLVGHATVLLGSIEDERSDELGGRHALLDVEALAELADIPFSELCEYEEDLFMVLMAEKQVAATAQHRLRKKFRDLKAGKQHTWGKGKAAPKEDEAVTLPGDPGLKVPLGPVVPTGLQGSSLLYNEFIVYDISQIKQRFVLQVKFHY